MGRKLESVWCPIPLFLSNGKSGVEMHSEDEPARGKPLETKE